MREDTGVDDAHQITFQNGHHPPSKAIDKSISTDPSTQPSASPENDAQPFLPSLLDHFNKGIPLFKQTDSSNALHLGQIHVHMLHLGFLHNVEMEKSYMRRNAENQVPSIKAILLTYSVGSMAFYGMLFFVSNPIPPWLIKLFYPKFAGVCIAMISYFIMLFRRSVVTSSYFPYLVVFLTLTLTDTFQVSDDYFYFNDWMDKGGLDSGPFEAFLRSLPGLQFREVATAASLYTSLAFATCVNFYVTELYKRKIFVLEDSIAKIVDMDPLSLYKMSSDHLVKLSEELADAKDFDGIISVFKNRMDIQLPRYSIATQQKNLRIVIPQPDKPHESKPPSPTPAQVNRKPRWPKFKKQRFLNWSTELDFQQWKHQTFIRVFQDPFLNEYR
ncbi:hypothetical protein HDU97_009924 [Phlyctochytrium planicorne]|nr:hypothetical protein HDU97_009924 [Phlyctochytrium planicorne]